MLVCGAHLSIAGGIMNAFPEAERLAMSCFQLFLGSPRIWNVKMPPDNDCAAFREAARAYRFIACHGPYLQNFATADDGLFEKSVRRAIQDMAIMARMGIKYYVIHPGTCTDAERGIARVREALGRIVREAPECVILVENTAGEKNDIGVTVAELAAITGGFGARVGLCLDTCHISAAGYDLAADGVVDRLYDELHRAGLDRMVAMIHANDSKYPAGARRDRHAHVGDGSVGAAGFFRILHHRFFRTLPFIMETPKDGDMDAVNLARLRELYAAKKAVV